MMYGRRTRRFELRLSPQEQVALQRLAEQKQLTAAEVIRQAIRQGSMTMYVYIQSEPGLFTVGFYSPDGRWHTDDDFVDRDEARRRVHYLNGGNILVAITKQEQEAEQ